MKPRFGFRTFFGKGDASLAVIKAVIKERRDPLKGM